MPPRWLDGDKNTQYLVVSKDFGTRVRFADLQEAKRVFAKFMNAI
jgi:hypothetical protein